MSSTEGHDHGMTEVQCPNCAGLGQVITPYAVPREDGTIDVWEAADICNQCAGEGTVWL